jgi:ketol-acid reductoisomerase
LAVRIYTDKDADFRWLKGKTCAVIGFGAQGRAHALRKHMQSALRDIRSGKFAREFIQEMTTGARRRAKLLRGAERHPIEEVGARLRKLMGWRRKI